MIGNVAENHVEDAKHLTQGFFPNLAYFSMYSSFQEKSSFYEPWFPAKLETNSMNELSIRFLI